MNHLITQMVCTIQKEECFIGKCDNCLTENLIDTLTHNNGVDHDEECAWTVWEKNQQQI